MDDKKVLEVIRIYRQKFQDLGAGQIDYPHEKKLLFIGMRRNAMAHCHGMLGKMEEFTHSNRMDKVFRWLGFVQGVLWTLGVYTLEELKNHNRPAE